ncbi:MAG: outer membrane protein assembly factor BamD [Deltaproteobacteria bacterium]|nr:outer membrane protein assembly factor BamD [Deltaproteobacteria bacterium]
MPLQYFVLIFLLFVCCTCGGSEIGHLKYGDAAQSLYSEALEDFYSGDCMDAEPVFRQVRREYPYSRFAALAELRIADCLFVEGKFVEAIQAYQQFVKHRPSHVEVPFARFRVAECYYEQIPSEWFLTPPAYERDQNPAQETLSHLQRFIVDYPKDPYTPKAKRLANEATALLAKHELYVAKFYLDRDQPRAGAARLLTLIRSYPESEVSPEALFLLGETYLELKEAKKAYKIFLELLRKFPHSEYADDARERLRS